MASVLLTIPENPCSFREVYLDRPLREAGHKVYVLDPENVPPEEWQRVIQEVSVYVAGVEPIGEALLEQAKNLKGICRFGVGYDSVDLQAAQRHSVQVGNVPMCHGIAVAEMVIAGVLSLKRSLVSCDSEMKSGRWTRCIGTELTGKTVGIVGLGHIGLSLVKLLRGFDVRVLAYDIQPRPQLATDWDFSYVALEDIIQQADVISLHLPLLPETRGMITAQHCAMFKEGLILANISRGGLIEESVLLAALNAGQMAGAVLDAYQQEPPGATELVQHPRVLALPHVGSATLESFEKMARRCFTNVTQLLEKGAFQDRVC